VAWLSKRVGTQLQAPDFSAQGFELLGGRLLTGETGPVAQFMYQDKIERRVTLYVRRAVAGNAETTFRHATENGVEVFLLDRLAISATPCRGQIGRQAMPAVGRCRLPAAGHGLSQTLILLLARDPIAAARSRLRARAHGIQPEHVARHASAILMPSTRPRGSRGIARALARRIQAFDIQTLKILAAGMRSGDEVRVSTPVSTASFIGEPLICWSNAGSASRIA